ncbi:MAG: radical SAM protein [Planctomycetota bacterium]|jgi:radical SAM protein with 4Fe4S-binding SPASM domain
MEQGGGLRAIRSRAVRSNRPLFAAWEITRRCPLRCRHCYLAGGKGEDELKTAEAKDLLRQMARLGVLFLTFTGGEPLVREDLFDIIDEAVTLGFVWRLFTSGAPLDEECARALAGRAPLAVDISLHGLEETHDAMTRVPGSWRSAIGAIRRLSGLGVAVNAKMSLTPQGLADLPALRELCEGLGANLNAATMMFPDLEGRPIDEGLRLTDEQFTEYCLERERRRPDSFGRRRPPQGDEPLCCAGRSSFPVSPGGDVRACLTLGDPCGNVRETPLHDIWSSGAMKAFRRLAAGARTVCRACEDLEFCSFCPGLAEKEAGDPLGVPPSACYEARIRHRLYLEQISCSPAGEASPRQAAGLPDGCVEL